MLDLLSLWYFTFQQVLDVLYQGCQSSCHCIAEVSCWSDVYQHSRAVAIVREEQGYTNFLLVIIITDLFCHVGILLSVVLKVANIEQKVFFLNGVDPPHLSICLPMECL